MPQPPNAGTPVNEPDAAAKQRGLSEKASRYAAQHPEAGAPQRPGLLERIRRLFTGR